MVPAVIRQGPNVRAASRRARGKRLRGAACLVETVKTYQHRARPGCPAPSPTCAGPPAEDEPPRPSLAAPARLMLEPGHEA